MRPLEFALCFADCFSLTSPFTCFQSAVRLIHWKWLLSGSDTENILVEMIIFLHNSKWKDELAEWNIKSALPLTCQFCDFCYLSSKLTLFSLGISTLSIHRRRSAHSSDWCARTRKTGTSWEWPSKRLRETAQHKCLKGRWPCRGPQSYTQKQIYKLLNWKLWLWGEKRPK